jgi:hypothetical protein
LPAELGSEVKLPSTHEPATIIEAFQRVMAALGPLDSDATRRRVVRAVRILIDTED